ncbi:DUF2178 domain-containing protein [Oceanobacillus neutriphilus]|uniref:DUF2178 domain-containing protein n=1 Tax=Oceanobacillus neutriphilus TaxID=531815 RepID=A0ABQ2NRL7_9BACI|nr:DUF2178 domain-containing protein [Oceanobacillus neutriphilus]GGP09132.1 hypothetical protein GCM10011346_11960 [Oceanobacillus neutriphilus]
MLNLIGFIVSFLGIIAFIFVIGFMKKEGNDERGDKILGQAGMFGFVSFLLGYNIIFLTNVFYGLNGEQYTFALACLLGIVLVTYSGTIFSLKKKY